MDADVGKAGKCCCDKPTQHRNGEASEAHAEPVGTSVLSTLSAPWIVGRLTTAVGEVPQVATSLTWRDRLGAWKVRWAIGRMRYRIPAGLYAVGNSNDESPVLVTANYKLTFDHLRSQMVGRDAWIVVLDTKGVNVWCAAAKGTFGTDELVQRIETTRVASVVSHAMLILPQLAAVGVTAHEVHKRSGFRVMFGPVHASDVPAFLAAGFKSSDMRFVRFPLWDRLALVPVELVQWAKNVLIVAFCLLLLAGLGSDEYSLDRVMSVGVASAVLLLAIVMAAVVLGPALLPWLPGRAFSSKGLCLGCGMLLVMPWAWLIVPTGVLSSLDLAAWCIAIPAAASFITMNFTGATPYTSLSGVRREVKKALPLQIAGAATALLLWGVARFV